jgi:glycosyltransferase involved in cell wall biosynthesis
MIEPVGKRTSDAKPHARLSEVRSADSTYEVIPTRLSKAGASICSRLRIQPHSARVVKEHRRPLDHLAGDALFLVWGPLSYGPRSRAFARELGIDVRFVYSTRRRGLLAATYKYGHQAMKTLWLLSRRRPSVVFVQSPPSFAAMVVWLYCSLTSARFVVDAHSAAMQSPYWTRPRWLYRHLARRAVTTIVTNEYFARKLRRWGGHALVVRDIPTSFPTQATYPVEGTFNVLVVNTFAPDEPLREVMTAAKSLENVVLYVTGDTSRVGRRLRSDVPANIRVTGYLADDSYYALMAASHAVLCLTTRDHTMQRGACEALSMGKPIITSKWPLLEDYFSRGTVHVDNTAKGIRDGVREMVRHHSRYKAEIEQLQIEQRHEWESVVTALVSLLNRSLAGGQAKGTKRERL